MGKIAKYLNQLIVGNVFDNPEVLEKYSTDYSALKVKPKFVAFPESTDDIRKLVRFFNQLTTKDIRVAVTARGGGHDKTGAALSNGIIISTERLNRLLEIDPRERLVHVQAGITLKELNTALSVSGLTIPVSGHDNETIGGLIANAPVDECAGKYGGIENYIDRIEAILPNGDCLQTSRLKKYAVAKKVAEKTPEGELYQKVSKLLHEKRDLVQKMSQENLSLAGYPSITKVQRKDTIDLKPLFYGSQGTLGIISEVILRAVPLKHKPMRVVATFRDLDLAQTYIKELKPLRPDKINLYDLKIIMEARETGKNLDGVIKKLDNGFMVYTCFTERGNLRLKKIMSMREHYPRTAKFIFEEPSNQLMLSEVENSLTSYLAHTKHGERVPILTDFYLPEQNLASFVKDLKILEEKLGLDLALYGSYTSSIYNLRPRFNLEEKDFSKKATTFLRAGAYVIKRQDGKLAGGTPEGRIKAVVTDEELTGAQKELYAKIKKIFDPNNILNPDIKLGANSRFTLTHFRKTNQPKI